MPEHNAGSRAGRRRRIMRALKINEISGVDTPAQEGATVAIMKRDDGTTQPPQTEAEFEKRSALTTSEEGHQHLIALNGPPDGVELNSGMTSWVDGHAHPWIRNEADELVVGTASAPEGEPHGHGVAEVSKRTFRAKERERLSESGAALPDGSFPIVTVADLKNAIKSFGRAKDKAAVARHIKRRAKALDASDLLPDEGVLADFLSKDHDAGDAGDSVGNEGGNAMTDKTKKAGDSPTVEELQAQLARANLLASLSDAEKSHYQAVKALDGEAEAETFLAKSADERKAEIEKAKAKEADEDPVVYTTIDGVALRKSAGEAFISMAKSNDNLRKRLDESETARAQDRLEKRAEEELPNLPGSVKERAALLSAAEGIEDEGMRTAAVNALKASNETFGKAFTTFGQAGGSTPAPGTPADALQKRAEEHQKANPSLTIEQAYDAVLKTPEGEELYAKSVN